MSRQPHVLTLAALFFAASVVPVFAQTTEDLARQVSDLAVQYDQSKDATQKADLLKQLQSASVTLTQAAMPLDRNGNMVDNPGTRENAARYTLATIGRSISPASYYAVSQDLVSTQADWFAVTLPPGFNLGKAHIRQQDKASYAIPGLLALYGYPASPSNIQAVLQNTYQLSTLGYNGSWTYPGCNLSCVNYTRNLWEFSYRKPEPPPPAPAPAPIQVEPAPVRGLW